MRNLYVCFDGTWNTPDQKVGEIVCPTNVRKFFNALAATETMKFYHPGVGTEGGRIKKLVDGAFGSSIDDHIVNGYHWLCRNYLPSDRIFIIGFSRGAYSARSLAGMIGQCSGLLRLYDKGDEEQWRIVKDAYQNRYRLRNQQWGMEVDRLQDQDGSDVGVYFVGAWDTVGALGVPDDAELANMLDRPSEYRFHDVALGKHVRHARHAVAMNEVRSSFAPTLWVDENNNPFSEKDFGDGRTVKQKWFSGVHADVGGGYLETGLSDVALQWMIEEASSLGAHFEVSMLKQIAPNPNGYMHDSYSGVFEMFRSQPRSTPAVVQESVNDGRLHASVLDRHRTPPISQAPYRGTRLLSVGDKPENIEIYAKHRWGDTGVYLKKGAPYRLTASGEWVDRTIPCGPGGMNDGVFHPGEIVQLAGSFLDGLEGWYAKVFKNKKADFYASRRMRHMPWFALVGAIANAKNPNADGTPSDMEYFLVGDGPVEVSPKASGYLYCFANDAWHFYENNRGSVWLAVERIA